MKLPLIAALLVSAGTVHAELLPRDVTNDGVADAYYDTVLDISWLADASRGGRFTWPDAAAYVAAMDVGGVVGWRLPTSLPDCLMYCYSTKPTPDNELGYHRYVNLGGLYYDFLWLHHNANYDLFRGITQSFYWTGVHSRYDPNAWDQYALAYEIDDGYTSWEPDLLDLYIWPVHDGDVDSVVPEPDASALLSAGLLSLALFAPGRRGTRATG